MSWAGRTVIVTGATGGIGAATAELFAASGASVVAHGLDAADGPALVRRLASVGGPVHYLSGDLRDPTVPALLADFAMDRTGRIDALVNNAGANVFVGVMDADLEDWNRCLDLDLRALWLCAKAVAPAMSDPGAIVNIASNHAHATMPGIFPYNVAKAAVVALTQSLALELVDQGIRVNVVCPGYVDTALAEQYFATFPDPAAARSRVESLHPVRRMGRPEEIAQAIQFLADPEKAGFITGTSLLVDGGRSTLLQDSP